MTITVTVTMLQTRQGEDGTQWVAGSRHDASVGFARLLIYGNLATGTLPPDPASAGMTHITATAAEIAALTPQPGAVYQERDGGQRALTLVGGLLREVAALTPGIGYASQFVTTQTTLPTRQVIVTATGQVHLGACAIVGVRCVAAGSAGTLTIHDDAAASDATKLRLSIAQASLAAGTYYPLVADDAAAMLIATGVYVTVTTGGAFALDMIDGTEVAGTAGAGMLCATAYVAASGLVLAGPASIVSVRCLAVGSAGAFVAYDSNVATAGREIYPSVAYNAGAPWLTTQPLRLGPSGGAAGVSNLYLTMPTAGIALVNYLPR